MKNLKLEVEIDKLELKKSLFCFGFNILYNIASTFVQSNSIARACFIFLLCMLMTSANKSLEKKISIGLKTL